MFEILHNSNGILVYLPPHLQLPVTQSNNSPTENKGASINFIYYSYFNILLKNLSNFSVVSKRTAENLVILGFL